jgi:hypothetical protein
MTTQALAMINTTSSWEFSPYVSGDESELYFVFHLGDTGLDDDIFVAPRADGHFIAPTPIAALVAPSSERAPVVSSDGLRLYFASDRVGSMGYDIYLSSRARKVEPFGAPAPIAELNTPALEQPDWISPDECTLYFRSNRPGGMGGRDVWRATRR